MRKSGNLFTLVELLAVLAIIVLIGFVSLPVFQKIMKGQGAELAANNISTKLNLARSYAISKRKSVAVLFPQVGRPVGIPATYCCTSYRTCIVEKNSSNSQYYFTEWIPGEDWEFLPPGTAILEVDSDDGVDKDPGDGTLEPDNDASVTLISPDPPALPGTAPNKPVDCSDISSGLSCTNFAGVIFKPTGAALAARFIEIGEAVYSPGTVSLVVTNKNPDAYVSLEVDEFTGRTTYKNK